MLQTSRLFPGIVHELSFRHLDSALHMLDGDGGDTLFFIGLKNLDGELTLNDRIGGCWGAEEKLILPPHDNPRRFTAWVKLTPDGVDIWNDAASHLFTRCTPLRAQQISLARLQGVDNPGNSLSFSVLTPEAMSAEIWFHTLNRRLMQMEASASGPLPAGIRGNAA